MFPRVETKIITCSVTQYRGLSNSSLPLPWPHIRHFQRAIDGAFEHLSAVPSFLIPLRSWLFLTWTKMTMQPPLHSATAFFLSAPTVEASLPCSTTWNDSSLRKSKLLPSASQGLHSQGNSVCSRATLPLHVPLFNQPRWSYTLDLLDKILCILPDLFQSHLLGWAFFH